MDIRKDPLVQGEIYHIYNRSIAKFVIFNEIEDYNRFVEMINLYQYEDFNYPYSKFGALSISNQDAIFTNLKQSNEKLIDIIAYCLMPTHIHLVLKQLKSNGVSKFMSKVLNSYSRYFNFKHHRKGPLWEGHFKNVLVSTDEQFLHLTRYIHLNPASAGIIKDPFKWSYSSLYEYISPVESSGICEFRDFIDLAPKNYRKFITDQKDYQRSLSIIKSLLIDNYSG